MTNLNTPKRPSEGGTQQSVYWMRAISFAGLHRLLNAVAGFPRGLRAGDIDRLIQKEDITLMRGISPPARTTMYHYRNTLLRINALTRDGILLRANNDDPHVCQLLGHTPPANGIHSLSDTARDAFAALVLKNSHCRSLFFDVFMPAGASCDSVLNFHREGLPVSWSRHSNSNIREVNFQNKATGKSIRCASHVSISAVLYGIRYWARDELRLIDEFWKVTDASSVMFPVHWPKRSTEGVETAGLNTVRFVLSLRTDSEWTLFSIPDLIARCCEARKQPRWVLFNAIDWFLREWPHHTVLIPTSHALATLTAPSPQAEILQLRNYYKSSRGPYISHIRLHKDITIKSTEELNWHVQHT